MSKYFTQICCRLGPFLLVWGVIALNVITYIRNTPNASEYLYSWYTVIFNIFVIFSVHFGRKLLKKSNKANDDLEFIMDGYTDPKYEEVEELFRTFFRKEWDHNS